MVSPGSLQSFILDAQPADKILPADKAYNAEWFHAALSDRKIGGGIPSETRRKFRSRTMPGGRAG
jgi:hypothetical protein